MNRVNYSTNGKESADDYFRHSNDIRPGLQEQLMNSGQMEYMG
jgi:hypothetical protein